MEKLEQLKRWFFALPIKEQRLVSATTAIIVITLFYLIVWEPLHVGLETERQKQKSQQEILVWMQGAAAEVRKLRASGNSGTIRDKTKPITLVIEKTINNAGLKTSVNKIESAGNNSARVTLKGASFNQILVWLNTLAKHNGIQVVSANFERSANPGTADARLTFERP
jgi:general secretion pathway protein M